MKRLEVKPKKNFFTKNPKEIAKNFAATIIPMIINNLKDQIEEHKNEQLSTTQFKDITKAELVSLRSPIIERRELYKGVVKLILENQMIKFEKNGSFETRDIAEQLSYVIMEELVKGGEIFYFDPTYYTEGHELCWIRY